MSLYKLGNHIGVFVQQVSDLIRLPVINGRYRRATQDKYKEHSSLLGCYVMLTGKYLPTFRRNVVTLRARSGNQIWAFSLFLDCVNLKMGEPGPTGKLISVCQSKGYNIPPELVLVNTSKGTSSLVNTRKVRMIGIMAPSVCLY